MYSINIKEDGLMFKFAEELKKLMQVFVNKNYVLVPNGPVKNMGGCMDCSNSCAENCAAKCKASTRS